jgi:hypothetical protein
MPIDVKAILQNAAVALSDERDHRRWPLAELLANLHDGVMELQERRPDAFAETRSHLLDAGARQRVTGVHSVLSATMNVLRSDPTMPQRTVRMVTRLHLDNSDREWVGRPQATLVDNAALDNHEREAFWVHPPSDGLGAVELQVSVQPELTNVASGDDPLLLSSYDFTLDVKREFAPALTYYVLHRAWAKDADFAANQQNSNKYYDWFKQAVGGGE